MIEALAGLLISIFLIRSNYNEPVKKIFRYVIYLPGVIIFPALFFLESIVFLQVQGIDFKVLAAVVAIVVVLIISLLAWGFKKLIPEFDLQLEMKFIGHLLQLIGGIVLTGVIAGIFWYQIKLKRMNREVRRER